jgi:hypothetical protein
VDELRVKTYVSVNNDVLFCDRKQCWIALNCEHDSRRKFLAWGHTESFLGAVCFQPT